MRNTYRALKDTTFKTVVEWFPPRGWVSQYWPSGVSFGEYQAGAESVVLTINGHTYELLFRSAETERDIKKFLSLELSGYWIDEACEVDERVKQALDGRLRWPREFPGFLGLLTTNPPAMQHWIKRDFFDDPLAGHRGYKQPPRENEPNLPSGYYDNILAAYKHNPEWAKRYVAGEFMSGAAECYFGTSLLSGVYLPRCSTAYHRGELFPTAPTAAGERVAPERQSYEFRAGEAGGLRVWRYPDRLTREAYAQPHYRRYVIGADVAEGLERGDYSAAYVLDRARWEVVAAWHGHCPPHVFAEALAALGLWYGEPGIASWPLVCVEANNHGLTVLTELRRLGYPNLYIQETIDQTTGGVTKRLGWTTTTRSKPLVIDGLARALAEVDDGPGGLIVNDRGFVDEALVFVNRDGKLGAAGDCHDDRVMAMALTIQAHKSCPAPVEHVPPITGWRARQGQAREDGAWLAA